MSFASSEKTTSVTSSLDRIEQLADANISDASSIAELKDSAELHSALAAARKANLETKAHPELGRLEWFKLISAFLVPLVSLVTVMVTVVGQNRQLDASREQFASQLATTRQQNEDTQWRELLTTIKDAVKQDSSDFTVVPRLRSFFDSPRYALQAREMAKRFLGRLTFFASFEDLFSSIIGDVSMDNIDDVLDIARTLRATMYSVQARCTELATGVEIPNDLKWMTVYYGLCDTMISDARVVDVTKNSKIGEPILQARRSYFELLREIIFVQARYLPLLRAQYSIGSVTATRKLDLSRVFVQSGDFSKLDMRQFDLSDTIFSFTKVDGAWITPSKATSPPQFWGTEWWLADKIDQGFLESAVLGAFPCYAPNLRYPSDRTPERSVWIERVKLLCRSEQEVCSKAPQQFGICTPAGNVTTSAVQSPPPPAPPASAPMNRKQ